MNCPATNAREDVESYVGRIEPIRPDAPPEDWKPRFERVEEKSANHDAGYAADAELEQLNECFPTHASPHLILSLPSIVKNRLSENREDVR